MPISKFDNTHLKHISNLLVEAASHGDVTDLLAQCGIEQQGGSPRWQRILLALEGSPAILMISGGKLSQKAPF
jgi:hypothetical protein